MVLVLAKNKNGANSTSVRKVSTQVGKPNQTAKSIAQRYKQDSKKQDEKDLDRFRKKEERLKKNYDSAKEIAKRYRDPNKNVTNTLNAYTRETIRTYLQAPATNEKNLRDVSRYLYYRSHIYYRLIQWYASMWDLRCRQVIPPYDLSEDNNADNILNVYGQTLDQLEIYNMQGNWYDIAVRCYKEDVCYSLFFRDDTGSVFYLLNADECMITGKYMTGDFSFAINMSKFKSTQKQQLIEWLGEPLTSMWNEYESSGVNYIEVPPEYAACFKFRSSEWDMVVPPMATLFQELSALMDLADYQAIADKQSIYKLVTLPMKTLAGAKLADDFEISPDLMNEYFQKMVDNALPDYASSAMVPGGNLEVVDFSTTSTDKDVDRYEQSQNTILSTAGGGAILNTSNITSTAAFKAWLKAETEFAISSLMPQVEGFTNRILKKDLSNPCKVKYFEVSVYTKDDLKDSLLESCQYSYSNRLAYNTFLGISEKDTLAMLNLEESILKLHEKMVYPLQSSYTQSGTEVGEVGEGRPESDPAQLSPSGERSRNE